VTEVFLNFRRVPIRPIAEVRSTLIMAGIQTLRAQGLYPRYSEILSPDWRERILGLAAGVWVPIEVAVAHYVAMDRLGIEPSSIETIAAGVAERTWKHTLAPVSSRAKRGGLGPWDELRFTHRTSDLNWRGGDVRIFKEGPTQALYEWVGQPCASVPYFVTSYGAFMRAAIGLFCERANHQVIRDRCSGTTIALRLSWVERTAEEPTVE
jgi:hypothetical protein